MPGDGGKDEERLEASSSKGHRGKAFTYPELMCCLFAALGTNEKFSAGKPGAVRLQTFNNAFVLRVRWMKEHDKWRDQFGKPVTKVTPEESIQTRCVPVNTATKDTPISYQVARVIGICRNHIAPCLDKVLNKDGTIPTGKQVADMQERLRVAYFDSLTGAEPLEPVSQEVPPLEPVSQEVPRCQDRAARVAIPRQSGSSRSNELAQASVRAYMFTSSKYTGLPLPYMYVCICVSLCYCLYTFMWIYMHLCVCVCVWRAHRHTHTYTRMHACMHRNMCVCVRVCECVCLSRVE
jgi:hypothetical protein